MQQDQQRFLESGGVAYHHQPQEEVTFDRNTQPALSSYRGWQGQAQAMFDALPEYQGYLAEFLTLGVLGVVIYK